MRDVTETVRNLVRDGVSLETYQRVQNDRVTRLFKFREIGVQYLIDECQTLIDYGYEVIDEYKKYLRNLNH